MNIVSDGAQPIGFIRLIIICQMTTTVTDGNAYSFHSLNLHKILLVGLMEVGITAVNLISVCYLQMNKVIELAHVCAICNINYSSLCRPSPDWMCEYCNNSIPFFILGSR